MPKSGPCSVLESIADEIGGLDKTIERLPLSQRTRPPLGYGPGGGGVALGPNGIAQRCGIRWALSCVNPASWLSLATRRKFAQHRPRLKAQLCTPRGQRRRGEEKRRGRTARVNKFIWARNCRQSTRVCSGRSILISDGNL